MDACKTYRDALMLPKDGGTAARCRLRVAQSGNNIAQDAGKIATDARKIYRDVLMLPKDGVTAARRRLRVAQGGTISRRTRPVSPRTASFVPGRPSARISRNFTWSLIHCPGVGDAGWGTAARLVPTGQRPAFCWFLRSWARAREASFFSCLYPAAFVKVWRAAV